MIQPIQPTDWKVVYGDRLQFAAYFGDQAKAEHYGATHHGEVRPLVEVGKVAQLDALHEPRATGSATSEPL